MLKSESCNESRARFLCLWAGRRILWKENNSRYRGQLMIMLLVFLREEWGRKFVMSNAKGFRKTLTWMRIADIESTMSLQTLIVSFPYNGEKNLASPVTFEPQPTPLSAAYSQAPTTKSFAPNSTSCLILVLLSYISYTYRSRWCQVISGFLDHRSCTIALNIRTAHKCCC